MRSVALLVMMIAVGIPACAPAATESPASQLSSARNILTQEEIRQASLPNAYEGVAALRSHWFNRGSLSVAVDDLLAGGINELREISASEIEQLELLDSKAASQRFGQRGFTGGVILVSLARAEPS